MNSERTAAHSLAALCAAIAGIDRLTAATAKILPKSRLDKRSNGILISQVVRRYWAVWILQWAGQSGCGKSA
jgi:hypothetical protein